MSDFSFLDSYNAGIDQPDGRDILVDDLELLTSAPVPVKVQYYSTPILNQ